MRININAIIFEACKQNHQRNLCVYQDVRFKKKNSKSSFSLMYISYVLLVKANILIFTKCAAVFSNSQIRVSRNIRLNRQNRKYFIKLIQSIMKKTECKIYGNLS